MTFKVPEGPRTHSINYLGSIKGLINLLLGGQKGPLNFVESANLRNGEQPPEPDDVSVLLDSDDDIEPPAELKMPSIHNVSAPRT